MTLPNVPLSRTPMHYRRTFQRLMPALLFPLVSQGFKPFTHFCQAVRSVALDGYTVDMKSLKNHNLGK